MVVRAAVLRHRPPGAPAATPGTPPVRAGAGALLVGELVLLARPDTGEAGRPPRHGRFQVGRGPARPYAAKLALGGWYYTGRFPDLADTLATGFPVRHAGNRGAYVLADRTLWSAGGGRPGALTGFAQLGLGDVS